MPLLVILFASVVLCAFLLRRGRGIAVAGLAAINGAGAVGLAWWAATILIYDGVLIEELTICAVLIPLLAAITAGGLALDRRGGSKSAVALLTLAALPIVAIYGLLFYLDAHPIAWR